MPILFFPMVISSALAVTHTIPVIPYNPVLPPIPTPCQNQSNSLEKRDGFHLEIYPKGFAISIKFYTMAAD